MSVKTLFRCRLYEWPLGFRHMDDFRFDQVVGVDLISVSPPIESLLFWGFQNTEIVFRIVPERSILAHPRFLWQVSPSAWASRSERLHRPTSSSRGTAIPIPCGHPPKSMDRVTPKHQMTAF